jgi:hypothetical protein
MARTVHPGPIYMPDPKHHREYRALHRGLVALGETLDNLKESYQ